MSDQKANINKAKDILERQGIKMKDKYSANAIGVGYKIENGKITDKVALIFYVNKKKTPEELSAERIVPIPDNIEGVPTDVVEVPGGFKPR